MTKYRYLRGVLGDWIVTNDDEESSVSFNTRKEARQHARARNALATVPKETLKELADFADSAHEVEDSAHGVFKP